MSTSVQRSTGVVTRQLLVQTLTEVSHAPANWDMSEMELSVQVVESVLLLKCYFQRICILYVSQCFVCSLILLLLLLLLLLIIF